MVEIAGTKRPPLSRLGEFYRPDARPLFGHSPTPGAKIAKAEIRLQAMEAELNKIKDIAAEYQKLGKGKMKTEAKKGSSLLAVIDKSSAKFQLKQSIKRITPEGKSKVRIQLKDARFDKLIGWLVNLAKSRGIYTQSISYEKKRVPDMSRLMWS